MQTLCQIVLHLCNQRLVKRDRSNARLPLQRGVVGARQQIRLARDNRLILMQFGMSPADDSERSGRREQRKREWLLAEPFALAGYLQVYCKAAEIDAI
jgi:hypothetical protein